ncbi:MAG: hypothetical protein A3D35_03600 [Candidatus Staskawiczbacteria bacterium RIFCSPHIGHO2_02_FULL_34_9]|uniref:Lipoprotein n=1 Tax=Candidatus Staskawiczbacteria bacterium RIFCSPHIGHO2_02_FULL_34_9 TaxID=1802206 RepID=A0A1G2HYA9_9BACT|nr:MAG: hypothetical protein A3D35_03600 [Candidatus Staskawiczbacteria bacterium RIFCSPHIGHO2_02_FULL_34_9]
MNKKKVLIYILIVLLVIGAVVYYFNYKNTQVKENTDSTYKSPSSPEDTIKIAADTKYSMYFFTDNSGMTLYHLTRDASLTNGQSTCLDDCAKMWPPFYVENIKLSDPLKSSDFTVITRQDGKKQLKYKGWPLYYYINDKKPGDLNGQGIENVWYAGISL